MDGSSPERIIVVGLGGRRPFDDWSPLSGAAALVARSQRAALETLPQGLRVDDSYDALFDRDDLATTARDIADDIERRSAAGTVIYLVPGLAWAGDATVAALAARGDTHILGGAPELDGRGSGQLQVIDALELAVAEQQEPFGAGLAPLDPTVDLLVTNLRGKAVVERATRRLRRLGFRFESPVRESLWCEPVDRLSHNPSTAGLRHIYARLRRPDGCPWDREQTEHTVLPHLNEEAQELRDALEREDWRHAAEELGDVFGNLLMIAQIAGEHGRFTFEDAVTAVAAKLVRRHPHVFGDAQAANAEDVLAIWQQAKAAEKRAADA